MTPELRAEWERFLAGHWTLDRPTRAGIYETRALGGWRSPERIAFARGHSDEIQIAGAVEWTGYFWSEPTPASRR